jgi:hypothetical protein
MCCRATRQGAVQGPTTEEGLSHLLSTIFSLPPATISSVPVCDFVNNEATEELANLGMKQYYPCSGKGICAGCVHLFHEAGRNKKCAFCNSDRGSKTDEEQVEEILKRVEANYLGAMCVCWLVIISMEMEVYNKMKEGQWNYGLRPRNLVPVTRFVAWVSILMKGEI